jgi:transposase-like protein
MSIGLTATRYKNHRFPIEIISRAVWLYFRFCLSFRDVEELLFERGVSVTYEAIQWCHKFDQSYGHCQLARLLHRVSKLRHGHTCANKLTMPSERCFAETS